MAAQKVLCGEMFCLELAEEHALMVPSFGVQFIVKNFSHTLKVTSKFCVATGSYCVQIYWTCSSENPELANFLCLAGEENWGGGGGGGGNCPGRIWKKLINVYEFSFNSFGMNFNTAYQAVAVSYKF